MVANMFLSEAFDAVAQYATCHYSVSQSTSENMNAMFSAVSSPHRRYKRLDGLLDSSVLFRLERCLTSCYRVAGSLSPSIPLH